MKPPTTDAHAGRAASGQRVVNPPVERGSTVLFRDYDTFRGRSHPFFYGRGGTATHRALCDSVAALDGAEHVALAPSGLAAVSLALLSFARAGGEVLVTDSAYDPTRAFCDGVLARMGVRTRYYDPLAGVLGMAGPDTCAVLAESPGSLTFEVQDVPALVREAGDVPVIVDNTWGAGVFLKPLALGAAVSVQAATKYLGGHSDVLMGTVAASGAAARAVTKTARGLGIATSPDDAALVHRGIRTLTRRLAVHEENGLALARWLEGRDEVTSVTHPGLPSHPQHALFERDFIGACGLFGAILRRSDEPYLEAFFDALGLFGMGYSWGGFESLCIPTWPARHRTATSWSAPGQAVRFHAGLEDIADLTADLDQAFRAANAIPEPAP